MPRILELWRYPVKSLGGEQLDRVAFSGRIAGDREWGVFDATTGKLLSAKSVAALLTARAAYRDGETTITLPSGTTLTAGTPAANDVLSSFLGRGVVLRRAAPAEVSTIDMELVDGGMDSFNTQPGSLYDSRSTLHLVSTSTLAALDRDHAPGAGDLRRYRPNLLIDDADEDGWVGRTVTVGAALTAHVRKRTERCVIVTREQPAGVAADRALFRMLKATRGACVGVYLDARAAGDVAVGDAVDTVPDAAMQNR